MTDVGSITGQVTWADYARAEQFLPWNATARSSTRRCARTGSRGVTASGIAAPGAMVRPLCRSIRPRAARRPPSIMCDWRRRSRGRRDRTSFTPRCLSRSSPSWTTSKAVRFDVAGKQWTCDLTTYECVPSESEAKPKDEVRSPDGKWAAFVRGRQPLRARGRYGSGAAITTDGEPYFAYAALPGSTLSAVTDRVIGRPAKPAIAWSPDSTMFVTYCLDERAGARSPPHPIRPHRRKCTPNASSLSLPIGGGCARSTRPSPRCGCSAGHDDPAPERTACLDDAQHAVRAAQCLVEWGRRAHLCDDQRRGNRSVALQVADAATGEARTILAEHGPSHVYPHHVPQRIPMCMKWQWRSGDMVVAAGRLGTSVSLRYS